MGSTIIPKIHKLDVIDPPNHANGMIFHGLAIWLGITHVSQCKFQCKIHEQNFHEPKISRYECMKPISVGNRQYDVLGLFLFVFLFFSFF